MKIAFKFSLKLRFLKRNHNHVFQITFQHKINEAQSDAV